MANIWETSARAVFCILCGWKCTGNLVSSVIVYIHYKQSVLFGNKPCLSELTLLVAAEIVPSAGCNFTLGAYKSTLFLPNYLWEKHEEYTKGPLLLWDLFWSSFNSL